MITSRRYDRPTPLITCLPILCAVLVACEDQNTYVPPPPPKVTVAKPFLDQVTDYLEFTGTTAAAEIVEVRARVPGILQSVNFEPGTWVEAGDTLFLIDPQEYEAAVQEAEAALAQAKARNVEAGKTLERAKTLIKKGNISQAKVDEAEADALSTAADIQAAEANLVKAKLNLSYAAVEAPIGGRVDRNLVDPGNLVGDSEPTLLTKITDYDPIYVYFSINELDLLTARKQRQPEEGSRESGAGELPVEISLADEADYAHEGVLDFAESAVDPDTGTLLLRGRFDNPGKDPKLLPGLFARVRVPIQSRSDVPLVSERAIAADQSGRYVLVVNNDSVVEQRNVRLGRSVDGLRVVEEGLQGDEFVVVNGIQRARPGGEVDPSEVEMASLKTSARQQDQDQAQAQDQDQEADAENSGAPAPDANSENTTQ